MKPRRSFADGWRFYRAPLSLALPLLLAVAAVAAAPPPLSGDKLGTPGGEIIVHPVNHATFLLGWNKEVIAVDPVGGAAKFAGLPSATLVLITDIHGDHLDPATLTAVAGANASLLVSPAVAEKLPEGLRSRAKTLANGDRTTVREVQCEALPAYNLTASRQNYHPKGRGNGYLLTLGDARIHISGDTEDIPEMRALRNIEAAFLCMNLPYTMEVEKAADAVKAFKPKVVYPYHSRGSDLEKFKTLVGTDSGTEVRLLEWYPK